VCSFVFMSETFISILNRLIDLGPIKLSKCLNSALRLYMAFIIVLQVVIHEL
jgi:hypothetical protein